MDNIFDTYRGKRVLITGYSGFKGSWLCNILNIAGAHLYGLALPDDALANKHAVSAGIPENVERFVCDVTDYDKLSNLVASIEPEIIFHLAAQSLVSISFKEPLRTFSTNIMGTANILDVAKKTKSVQVLVCVTSDKCYQNNEWVWGYRENDGLGGSDPYSISKACAELIYKSFEETTLVGASKLGVATARAGNVIGGGDWSVDRIIPDCIRSLSQGMTVKLRRPRATRPWQHVLEPLSGYMLLGKKLFEKPREFHGAWNFGPPANQCIPVELLVKKTVEYYGHGSYEVNSDHEIGKEAGFLQLNCDKANMLLGWHPRWDLDTTVFKTVDWYKKVLNGQSVRDVTITQINEYFDC